ncbi:MAG: ParB/RepB/Spo0J family partition protein [Acutalibacteraceae bacterium]|nr:ParB/RepB/Spo0J family partition protein [Clostridiales bacterium]
MAAKQRGLGRGLDSLFEQNTVDEQEKVISLRLTEIVPNREQPRKQFDEEGISELAASITQHGLLQPLTVRPLADGTYQLVAGERRWRASRLAGLDEVPVIVREMSDREAAEIALIENLQREDLNPMEEAVGLSTLMETYGLTQEETAKAVSKSRPAVTNALRLLHLPAAVREMVGSGQISAGHARAILSFSDEEQQVAAAKAAAENGWSVREVERQAKKARTAREVSRETSAKGFVRDSFFDEVELALTEHLGRRVKVAAAGSKGTLQLEFYDKEDLQALANRLAPSVGAE